MSTFDDPFDADRRLEPACICGQHRSAAEHQQAAQALRCEEVASEDKRYEGVVASAVMRAVFPRDAARRAFLKSVGASTALAAVSRSKTFAVEVPGHDPRDVPMVRIGKPELVIASVADSQRDHTDKTSWQGLVRPSTSS